MICCRSCNNSCSYVHRGHKQKHRGAVKGKMLALGETESLAFFQNNPAFDSGDQIERIC